MSKEKPKTVWDLQNGDMYFAVHHRGRIYEWVWSDDDADMEGRSMGNAFMTRKEAEARVASWREEARRAIAAAAEEARAVKAADEKRAADVEHRRSINRDITADLVAAGLMGDEAILVVTAINKGAVRHVSVRF